VLVLAGAGSWWMPGWLNRLLPHVDIEGSAAHAGPAGGRGHDGGPGGAGEAMIFSARAR
jgi:putative drug exporter of the RND superfamily